MCSVEDQPWRVKFTGPPCRCGVPTPGNDEERRDQEMHRQEARQKRVAKAKIEFEKYKRTRRINNTIQFKISP